MRPSVRAKVGALLCVAVATAVTAPGLGGRPRRKSGAAQVLEQVMPAVVQVYGRRGEGFRGVGAGVILTAEGVIVTHTSNIAGVDEPTVVLDDGRRFKATVLGTDAETETALLRIPAEGLSAVRFADSAKVRPGQWVLAIGNPFGMAQEAEEDLSANLGVITAYTQVTGSGFKYRGYVFLTDAQINPGSYGGALVDLDGLLVALNGRVVTSEDTETQMGVAIPVNDVLPGVVRILKEEKERERATSRPAVPTTRPAVTQPARAARKSGPQIAQISQIGGFHTESASSAKSADGYLVVSPAAPSDAQTTLEEMRLLQGAFNLAAKEVAPSVVSIVVDRAPGAGRSTRQVRRGPQGRIQMRRGDTWEPAPGAGTGLIISETGLVLTSTYYTSGAVKRVLVLMPDGTPHRARILGRDEGRGVVLLGIDAAGLPVPRFADPGQVRVGQWVMALGRTYGEVDPSVNVGIVSATGRISGRAVQTDTAISPINYGGPLVDLTGRVVGLCVPLSPDPRIPGTAFYDSGIGFAVPVTDLLPVLPRLLQGEVLHPGFLGIEFDIERLVEGAAVRRVEPGTAAARVGLRPGDVIVELDGQEVRNGFDLMNRIGRKYAGEKVSLAVKRGEDLLQMTAALGERPKVRPPPSTQPTTRPASEQGSR